ncbi:hypothetical protein PS723_00109 [Pseudomonas fluorescens]|uniref:Uncharacterized protein n=1 Tax=Pseudomonas fluorescens TaxID=294 RepID=A0A5E6ZJ59_PSEFL|nr:hypothetical protein PS723_00109 [Pseudomonas fluorescens]
MRVLVSNLKDDFRVKAYAGTNGVLLAMDLAESRRAGLLGFAIEKQLTENNPMQSEQALFAGFSSRSGQGDLQAFVEIISATKKDLLFATAFALPERILDALLGQPHDQVLRYGLQNRASRISGYHADRTAEFTATALLNNGLEG